MQNSTNSKYLSPGLGRVSRMCALLAVSLITVLPAANQAYAAAPVATDLGNLGGGSANATALAEGYVAGSSTTAGGERHAFVWSAATNSKRDIGALLGSPYSGATSVNSRGEVVGGYYAPDFSSATAFYWSEATGVVIIGPTGNFNQSPLFISENGVVAGVAADNNHVFRWKPGGVLEDLGGDSDPNRGYFSFSAVTGINARGDIVGNFNGQNLNNSFIAWASGNTLTTLNSPSPTTPPPISEINEGHVDIQVSGISDNGVVIGTYWDYQFIYSGYAISQGGFFNADVHNSHAFKWTAANGFSDLGNLGTVPLIGHPTYSTFGSSATAINASGKIVGYSFLPSGGYAAFVYNPDTASLTQLPYLNNGDDWGRADGINADDVVVGYSGSGQRAVMWQQGVITDLTPAFAPQYPGSPFIKGSTIAGNGLDQSWNSHAWVLALPHNVTPVIHPPEIFRRTSATGEPWQAYTVTFSPTNSGNYTLSVNVIDSRTHRDSTIYLDDMRLVSDATELFQSGFEAPAIGSAFSYPSGGNGTALFGDWVFNNYSGVINGHPSIWGSIDAQEGSQRGFVQTYQGTLSSITTAQTFALVAGQNYTLTYYQASRPGSIGDEGDLTYTVTIDEVINNTPPPDTQAPVVTAPAGMIVEATGPAGAMVNFANATATDNVAVTSGPTSSPASGSTFPLGTTTVTCTAADAAGNVGTATFTVTVRDTTAPALTAPASQTLEATSAAGASATFAATATDAVGVTSLTYSAASGTTFPIGVSTVTVTAKDAAGNVGTATFAVTVRDTTAPALTAPASRTLEATSAAGASATFAATATDAVGVTSLTYSAASGTTFPIGVSTVTVTAKDAAGNVGTATFTVTVRDTTAPALTAPASQTLEATSAAGASATFAATATDAVGVTSLTYSAASGTTFPIGTSTVTVTAKDAAGNTTTRSFTITVRDTTAPVISAATVSSGELWPPNHKMIPVTLTVSTGDLVGIASTKIISVTSNETSAKPSQITGDLTVNLEAARDGNGSGRFYTITVRCTDTSGNYSDKVVIVTVAHDQR